MKPTIAVFALLSIFFHDVTSTSSLRGIKRQQQEWENVQHQELDLIELSQQANTFNDDAMVDDDDDDQIYQPSPIVDMDSFECTIAETAGSVSENDDSVEEDMITCERDAEHPLGDAVFEIIDKTEVFFQDYDLSHGDVRIQVPTKYTNARDQIVITNKNTEEITVTSSGDDRRRKLNSSTTGVKRVLIIRVSDDNDTTGLRKVAESKWKLGQSFFGNNPNLKTIYRDCSNSKLTIAPAQGDKVSNKGVISIPFPKANDPIFSGYNDSNTCGKLNYVQLGNWALNHPDVKKVMNSGAVDNRFIVMPNNPCVDFRGGEAWARVNGDLAWFQSRTAAFPIVQVHEYGHNLGLRHSGAPSNGAYSPYGDGTGYMGNKVNWNSNGAKMCFNAAKTYYLGWYSSHHMTLTPSSSKKIVKLVSLADIQTGKNANQGKLVLKLNSGSTHLYLNYNKAEGNNAGVVQHPNKVVVVKQNGRLEESQQMGAITNMETLRLNNWDGSGANLLVKLENLGFENGADFASVSVRLEGSGSEEENSNGGNQCKDTLNWYDADGPFYNCEWYASNDSYCATYGNGARNFGKTANEACCACQGGTSSKQTPSPTPAPTRSPTRAPTRSPTVAPTPAPTPRPQQKCKDTLNWHDADGPFYTCDWYASHPSFCATYGSGARNFGKTANEACCVCKT